MARRSYSIVVDPERCAEPVDALAERIGPLPRQSVERLAEALDRGALTLETDLQRAEAERLFRQLERRSTPVEIRDGEGEVVDVCRPDAGGASRSEGEGPEEGGGAGSEPGLELGAGAETDAEAVLEFSPSGSPNAGDGGDGEMSGGADAVSDDPPELELGLSEVAADPEPMAGTDGEPEPDGDSPDPRAFHEALDGGAERSGELGEAEFEDRPAHVPALAAFLSLLAPGAGQAYNGD
jgi:hypothetical protein